MKKSRAKHFPFDYSQLDRVKRLAQEYGAKSSFVWEEKDSFHALVVEGLGTKNLLPGIPYDVVAQDTVAAIVNDLITVGARPQIINAYFAVGSPAWFSNKKRTQQLISGWAKACKLAGAVWGGGETPSLSGIINPKTIDLAGSAVGIIKPKSRLVTGEKLVADDAIVLIESNCIHANGLTLVRKLKIVDRNLFRPTHIYVKLLENIWKSGIDVHYMVNITGHGWRKLMRARKNFTYRITTLPDRVGPCHRLFQKIQKVGKLSDREMYATFNMGAGFAIYLPQKDVPKVQTIAKRLGFQSWHAGIVEKGLKQVIIEPLTITFSSEDLAIR